MTEHQKIIRERALKIASKRVEKLFNQLRLIGNMGHTNNYDFLDGEKHYIVSAIRSETERQLARFLAEKSKRVRFNMKNFDEEKSINE